MSAADFLFYNGKLVRSDKPLIGADNRSFRYGDGCFETMRMVHGKIPLGAYHFERLLNSLELLKFDVPAYFTPAYLEESIAAVAEKNGHSASARIRLTVTRGDGGLYDTVNHFPNHLIQTWELDVPATNLNENGLVMGVFKDARRTADRYSPLKNNNYLPSIMAALWAKEKKLNEAVLLNAYDRVADATIANVFMVKDGTICTPALTEGAVDGVMRRHLLSCLRKAGMPAEETKITVDDLLQASEVFLTNAVIGIKWVKQVAQHDYSCHLAQELYQRFIKPLNQ